MLRWDHTLLARLDAAVGASRGGQPVALLITGEPGTGKTALLTELAERAPDFTIRRAIRSPATSAGPATRRSAPWSWVAWRPGSGGAGTRSPSWRRRPPPCPAPTTSGSGTGSGILLAFCQFTGGYRTETIAASLARVQPVRMRDAGLDGVDMLTVATMTLRQHGMAAVAEQLGTLPARPADVPLAATDRLGWRGMLQARTGFTGEAVADLTEFARRVEAGVSRLGAGLMHAFLGFAYWLRGDWSLARVTFRLAADLGIGDVHPMTAALVPLADIGEGRFDAADAALQRAVELLDGPWPEVLDLLAMVRVIRAHAGTEQDRARLGPLGQEAAVEVGGQLAHAQPLLMHLIQARIWTGDLAGAQAGVDELARLPRQPGWLPAVAHWLRGLVHEARGEHRPARA